MKFSFAFATCMTLSLATWTSGALAQLSLFPPKPTGPQVNDLVRPGQENLLQSLFQVEAPIEELIVFGDSLSDPGNLNKRTLGVFLPPQVYYRSRFSNGPVWADYVGAASGWKVTNFAVGGAETRTQGIVQRLAIPSFLQQITENDLRLRFKNKETALVTVWIGANNYLNGGSSVQDAAGQPKAEALEALVQRSVADIEEGLARLYQLGFKRFAIGSVPELSGLPVNPQSPLASSQAVLAALTARHNVVLKERIAQLQNRWMDASLQEFQAFAIDQSTRIEAEAFGFTELSVPCFEGDLRGNFYGDKAFCPNPSERKFWEYQHPNSKMHCYYASQFLAAAQMAGWIGEYGQDAAIERCLGL